MERPHLILAPGASGKLERVRPFADALRQRGVEASVISLPRGAAERAIPAWRAAAEAAVAAGSGPLFIGGQSFGGRVASLLAASTDPPPPTALRGLVLLSFPLHPPGRPERAEERAAHFAAIRCPVLLLSGESDPFAQLPLLRRAAARLSRAQLVTYPRLGHSLLPVLDDVVARIAAFVGTEAAEVR
jgi:predicted alpha/beta-hydrolase family hydrolase